MVISLEQLGRNPVLGLAFWTLHHDTVTILPIGNISSFAF